MGETQNHTRVNFRIIGDTLDPDKVTELFEITPDKSYRVGDPIERTTPVPQFYNHTQWSIRSEVEPEMELQFHIHNLLQKLLPHAEIILELSKSYRVEFYCSIFGESNKPQILLHHDILSGLSKLGASVMITTYCSE